MSDVDSKLRSWFSELRRRKVIRVAAVYLVAAWLLIQVADAVFEPMGLPAWSIKLVIVLAALGFPLACATAWAFDVTPRGIERTPDVAPQAAVVAPAASPVAVLPVVAPAPPAAAPGESVAILPFVDMSPAKDQEYFCDGIAEEIINALCCIRDLHVASRTSSFQFKGRAADVREIGKALNVGSVLEGSVRKAGDRVRITAQLVSATDGYHLWSESFDRDISDVFAIQTEIAQRLLKALKLTLSRREAEMMERGGTANADAYDLYLRGRLHMRYGTSTLPAAEMFRQAIQRDPQFAQAYAGLANALAMRGIWRLNSTEDETEEAMAASRRALELDPLLPEAYVARACLLSMQGRAEEAVQDFEEAIRLNPASYFAYYMYGRHVFAMGRIEQAVSLYEAADRLQPDDYQILCMLFGGLQKLGDGTRMQQVGERAMRAIDRQLQVDPDDGRALQLGAVTAATLGLHERARDLADRAMRARPNEFGTAYNLACAFAVMGDRDRALQLLHQAVRFGRGNLGWIEHDPDFDGLRGDPRFENLVATLRSGPATQGDNA
jgi:TolB-like protein/Flp pilus assembly protein TadD